MTRNTRGFTLIELLIVVAIIAILAAIAVPNFLEAQVRSKVSRVRADLRTMATAVESYAVDYNKYPGDVPLARRTNGLGEFVTADSYFPNRLSTPVAYITTARPPDPFVQQGQEGIASAPAVAKEYYRTLWYQNVRLSLAAATGQVVREYLVAPAASNYAAIKQGGGWGNGTDWGSFYGGWKMGSLGPIQTYDGGFNAYDATNGTISEGDIYRTQVKSEGGEV